MDPYKVLGITPNPDGSLTRHHPHVPDVPAADDPAAPVASRDVPLIPARNTSLRLHLPRAHLHRRLPVLLDFHGGGFILFSTSSSFSHHACARVAATTPALVISVNHRLAPEHPLPAAYDDAADALLWLASPSPDPWIRDHADLSRCFLVGTSSGGNIAYHLGVRALSMELGPVRVAGIVLNQPYFGGEERTDSELRFRDDRIIPLAANDLMWSLALPRGSNRDHEFSNPMRHVAAQAHGRRLLPRCLVRGHGGDPLVDRQREAARVLEERAEGVVARFADDGSHGAELFDEAKMEALLEDIRVFVEDCGGGGRGEAPLPPSASTL